MTCENIRRLIYIIIQVKMLRKNKNRFTNIKMNILIVEYVLYAYKFILINLKNIFYYCMTNQ